MSEKVVVIGGVALGTKSACRLKRVKPEAEVVLLDKDEKISYGGCGIPFYVSGDVAESEALQSTAFHMLRDEKFFRDVKGFEVKTGVEAVKIDRDAKKVLAVNKQGENLEFDYDKLVIGTGSRPKNLGIKGQDLGNIFSIGNLDDAIRIKNLVASGGVGTAVIVGAGFIGLEMAESFADMWGIETSVVEVCDQIMPGFVSPAMAQMAMRTMENNEVSFYTGEKVVEFTGDENVSAVITDKRTIEADIVIMAVGIVANAEIAKEAGLDIGPTGAIVVNEKLETSDPDIYAGGDCAEILNLLSKKPGYYPLGSLANRHGRIIGTNLAGGNASVDGAVGSWVLKIFEYCLAGTGLTLQTALDSGYDAISVMMCQMDRAHFYPENHLMHLELIVDQSTRQILGIQGLGTGGDALVGRVNTIAGIIKYKPTIEDISNLEFAYSPPFSAAMDIINALANIADNVIANRLNPVTSEELATIWDEKDNGEYFFIDCREKPDAAPLVEKYPDVWNNIPQGEIKNRLEEIPKDKNIILVCNTGMRSYEAQLNLTEMGFSNTKSVYGGVKMVKDWGLDI